MVCKAMRLLVTRPLLTSCLFALLSCAITSSHNETRETTEFSTIHLGTVTTATNASQTTAAGQATSSAVFSASVITTRTSSSLKTSTNQPPISISTGATETTTPAHTASTFDTGSFFGGMVLALSLTLVLCLGYKFFCSREEIRYRTIEEHDAII